MTRIMPALLSAILLGILLTGCSMFKNHSNSGERAYQKSTEARPLEVPPELDKPNTTGALRIPEPGSAPTRSGGTVADSKDLTRAPDSVDLPPSSAPIVGAGVTLSGDGLRVADTPGNTWSRVGLALVRSGTAKIISSDEAGLSYDVETTGKRTEKAGWFKSAITLGHGDKEVPTQVRLKVRVSADGDASRVSISGEDGSASRDASDQIIKALRERMS